jgi:dihydrofolate reductase
MGTIAVHEFISLDGVFENPSWTFDYEFDPKMGNVIADVMGGCEAILLGHTTFEMFAPAWSPRTAAEDPGAPFMNDSPKYVVASTPLKADWKNSTALGPYSADAIRDLKSRTRRGLYVSGSGTLVRAMLADHLVDELHLFMFPVALGSGGRLFGDAGDATKLELKGHEVFDNGVVYLGYRSSR